MGWVAERRAKERPAVPQADVEQRNQRCGNDQGDPSSDETLDLRRALDVADNVTALARDPYPAGLSTVVRGTYGLYLLRVGDVNVLYDVEGSTIRILMVTSRRQSRSSPPPF